MAVGALLMLGPAAAAQQAEGGGGGAAAPGGAAGEGGAERGEAGGRPGFADVAGHWAHAYVDALVQAGVLEARPGEAFRPDEPVSRLDFAVWVARAMELQPVEGGAADPFTDWGEVPVEARPWVLAAVREGLVNGYPDRARGPDARAFGPGRPITRAELGTVFGRALIKLGLQKQERYGYLFADWDTVPRWASDALASVQAEVIMGRPGIGVFYFAPAKLTTRAEAATMINRFLNARAALVPVRPAPAPEEPARRPGRALVAAYYIDTEGAYRSLLANGRRLDLLFYFSNQLDAQGNLAGFPRQRVLEAAASFRLPVLLVVKNDGFSRSVAHAVLTDPRARRRALEAVVRRVREQGYAGVNLDFENVDPADRDAYSSFVRDLAAMLRPDGFLVTAAVPARDARMVQQEWARAYDYAALGEACDYLVIMTYDQHYSGSAEPGPVGGILWMEGVLAYATGLVPPEKIVVGVPSYGYDWPEEGGIRRLGTAEPPGAVQRDGRGRVRPGKARPIRDHEGNDGFYSIEELASVFGGTLSRDPVNGETMLRYGACPDGSGGVRPCRDEADWAQNGEVRVVYFTDEQGLAGKLALAQRYGLRGAAMWRLGFEPDSYWGVFERLAAGEPLAETGAGL